MTHHFSGARVQMRPDRLALTSVLALWALMVSLVFGCIAVYGRNVPLAEDWNMVPAMVGHEPNLVEWLWAQNNEHRLPLQKAGWPVWSSLEHANSSRAAVSHGTILRCQSCGFGFLASRLSELELQSNISRSFTGSLLPGACLTLGAPPAHSCNFARRMVSE